MFLIFLSLIFELLNALVALVAFFYSLWLAAHGEWIPAIWWMFLAHNCEQESQHRVLIRTINGKKNA